MAGLEEEHDMIPSDLQAIIGTTDRGSILGIFPAYRSATRAAHHVAQFAGQISSQMTWKSVFPEWLYDVTSLDYV